MKSIVVLLLVVFCVQSCGTRKESPSDKYTLILQQLVEDARAVNKADKKQMLDLQRRMESAFRNLPVEAEQDDSLVWYFQRAFSYYFEVAREYQTALALMDSLAALHTPFLEAHAQYELLGTRTNLNVRLGRIEQATAQADSLVLLPVPKEGWRLIQYYTPAAGVYNVIGSTEKAIATFEKSVELIRKGVESDYTGTTLAWLGVYYNQTERSADGSKTILEAIRYFETHPENGNTVVAYGEQANTYYEMGLIDKALEMNLKSIAVAKRNGGYSLGNLFVFRAEMHNKLGHRDSMFYYYNVSKKINEQSNNKMGCWVTNLYLAGAYVNEPDSMAKALTLIDELCKDSVDMSDYFRPTLNYVIGQAWIKSGQTERAIHKLEDGVRLARNVEKLQEEYSIYSLLMDAYIQTGQYDRLAKGFERFKFLTDSVNTEETKRLVASTNIRFETEKKEQENRLLTTEVELKDSRLRNYAFIGLMLVAIGACIGAWFWMRQRALSLHLRLEEKEKDLAMLQLREQEEQVRQQEERLQQIIVSRQELNRNNEDLLRQLAEIQEANDKTCDLDRVMERLQPKLITNVEEEQFRTAFNSLHPAALHRLRTTCVRITRSEELLCMLILLKQTNEEVSRTLGISRSSVLQNRYRLKSKLELPEGVELDSEVERIMLN